MDTRIGLRAVDAISLVILLLCVIALRAHAQDTRSHPGKVVDSSNQRPAAADVTGYPVRERTGDRGGCPLYGEALDARQASAATGEFTLRIASEYQAFLTTFCHAAYYPRTEREDNSQEGTLIQPHPMEIFPRNGSQQAFQAAMRRTVNRVFSDLRYFNASRPDELSRTLEIWKSETKDPALKQFFESLFQLTRQARPR